MTKMEMPVVNRVNHFLPIAIRHPDFDFPFRQFSKLSFEIRLTLHVARSSLAYLIRHGRG